MKKAYPDTIPCDWAKPQIDLGSHLQLIRGFADLYSCLTVAALADVRRSLPMLTCRCYSSCSIYRNRLLDQFAEELKKIWNEKFTLIDSMT